MSHTPEQHVDGFEWMSYGDFGVQFFRHAVTAERVSAALAGLSDKGMKLGPLTVGPFAKVTAEGRVGQSTVTKRDDAMVSFDVTIEVSLSLAALTLGQEISVACDIVIDLVFTARAADALLVVIDVAPVTSGDVRLTIRGADRAVMRIIDPITGEIRRQVARRVNAMLEDQSAVRDRVIDVAAKIDGRLPAGRPTSAFGWISYEEFGDQFFRHAVTKTRIAGELDGLTGRPLMIGPVKVGPMGIARVSAEGAVARPSIKDGFGLQVAFNVTIPVDLDLVIQIGRKTHYHADIAIGLVLTARAAKPLLIVVDIPPVSRQDIEVEIESKGMGASMLKTLGGLQGQIRQQVANEVNEQLKDSSGRVIDVAKRIDGA